MTGAAGSQPTPPVRSLAFLGPAVGGHPGWVTTQGEVLAGLFADDGHPVLVSSRRLNPVARGWDHAADLVRSRRQVEVVIVSVFGGRAFALATEAIGLARALGLPSVAWLHGGGLPTFGDAHPRWVRRVLEGADAVVAPTEYLARWASDVVPDVRVIPNVLDLDAYRYRPRSAVRPRLLWMRTFHELYDPSTAVRALAALRALGMDATLTMAGQDKGLLAETRAQVTTLGLEGAVSFPGFVTGGQKAALLDRHDVFLNTNVVDNAPVTVLEAAASGLAVVSTDAGGIPDLLTDRKTARLVPTSDPEAMARAVEELVAAPAAVERLTLAARSVAERSAWPAVRERWLELVGGLLDRGRTR